MIDDIILTELQYLIGVAVSVVLGFAIGFERKLRYKEAGIRTHTIVCLGSALMMVISKYAFSDIEGFDPARIAAQIVSGIGFLGAGIIMFRGQKMYGLTTAAGVWATAGIGMAAGAGLYVVAVGATILLIAMQCLFHSKFKIFHTKKFYRVKIIFSHVQDESTQIKDLFDVKHFNSLTIKRDGDKTVYHAVLNTDKEYHSDAFNEYMGKYPFILSIERYDAE